MKIKIYFNLGNAAYTDEDNTLSTNVVADSLRDIAMDVENGVTCAAVRDVNGNTVGSWEIYEEADEEKEERNHV